MAFDLDDEELKATRKLNGIDKNVGSIEEDIKEDIKIIKELMPKLHRRYRNALIEIIQEVNKNTCTYKQTEIDYNSWRCSNCKCEWCFDEGNPKDNNTNFCPECGARIENFIELKEEDF